MKNAYDSILKYFSFFMLFLLVSRLCKGKGKIELIYGSALVSLLLVAITGMLTMSGYIDLKGVTEYNRLYGLYQYPNTTGSMLGAGVLICVGLIKYQNNKLLNLALQVILLNLFIGFVLTLSLGSFLVFAVVALVYFLVVNSKAKLNQLSSYLITVLSSMPILISYFNGNMSKTFLLSYTVSMFLAVILQLLYISISDKYITKLSNRTSTIIVLSIIILMVAVGILAFMVGDIVPQSVIDDIWKEELKIGNANDRLVFTKDAVDIFIDNFLFGAGGGAWQDIYFKYQSFPYSSTEAHNFYVQLAVETGIIGIAVLSGILFLLCKSFVKAMKADRYGYHIPAYFGILMILGHALLDFDLSLAAPMFLLMTLMGIINGAVANEGEKAIRSVYPIYGFILLGAGVLFLSATTYLGILNGNDAANQVAINIDKAESLYSKAMAQDKYNCAARIDYAQIMYSKFVSTNSEEYLKKMEKALDDIEKYEPYNWKYKPTIISLLLSTGKLEKGLEMTDNMVSMKPLDVNAYVVKAQVNLQIADYFYKNNMYDEAVKYADHTIATQEELQAAAARSTKPLKNLEQVKELVEQAQVLKSSIETNK
jgi:tetratricopeptide (TPR) repeat protein